MPTPDKKEARLRRIRRELLAAALVAVVLAVLFYFESIIVSKGSPLPFHDNIFLFGIININIILIILLAFLIIRNIVKFLYEKKGGFLGTKLRTKMVLVFAIVALVPPLSLFAFSTMFLSDSVDNWFGYIMEEPLGEITAIVEAHQQQSCRFSRMEANLLSESITANALFGQDYREALRVMFGRRINSQNLAFISLYMNKTEMLRVADPSKTNQEYHPLAEKNLEEVFEGKTTDSIERTAQGVFARSAVPLVAFPASHKVIGAVVVDSPIDPNIAAKMDSLTSSHNRREELLRLKEPIKIAYVATLLSVTLLVMFMAIWFGLLIARNITEPIDELAEATKVIASGNLNFKIEKMTDDEIGTLVDSFNQMTATIKKTNEERQAANRSIEERRKYIATVLEYASTGVIAIDKDGLVTTFNSAAQRILSTPAGDVLSKPFSSMADDEHQNIFHEIRQDLEESPRNLVARHLQIRFKGKVLELLATITKIFDETGNPSGIVVVFDDMTRLQQAERAAAWREVAKKMAHEIKNPLTPIQLSAQRLQRRFGKNMAVAEDATLFEECTQTIVNQVAVLKRLVNAFSEYAKLPATELAHRDINLVIAEAINLFKEAHRDIEFIFVKDDSLPMLNIDAEKVNRVMVNLLDNAVSSLEGKQGGAIKISSSLGASGETARVEVRDNGCGISPQNKERVFEPYFSTKSSGTGLGLAIVSSIISDHGGTVGIADNDGNGAIVFFEIPLPTA